MTRRVLSTRDPPWRVQSRSASSSPVHKQMMGGVLEQQYYTNATTERRSKRGPEPLWRGRSRAAAYFEVYALGVLTISHGCFERCCSNTKTPP